jgi:hypothetical protein
LHGVSPVLAVSCCEAYPAARPPSYAADRGGRLNGVEERNCGEVVLRLLPLDW